MADAPERQGPRTRPNYLYAIISVALVLFLLGFFGLIILEARHLVTVFKERVNLMVELDAGTPEARMDELRQVLQGSPYTKEGSTKFVSREEAAELMREDFGDDFLRLDLPNPFYDVLIFNVQASYMDSDSLARIRSSLRQYEYVNDVFYQESLVDDIAENIQRVVWIALGTGLFFVLITIALIHNTIRLALYSNRFIIKNMELVGASWGFISRPYLWRAVLHGLVSGLIAVAGLLGLLWWVQQRLPELSPFDDPSRLLLLAGGLILLGIVITWTSTYYVVNKYLKMRVDDLY